VSDDLDKIARAVERIEKRQRAAEETLRRAAPRTALDARADANERMRRGYAASDPAEQRAKRRRMEGEFDPKGGDQ
jgi:hypothetical protein